MLSPLVQPLFALAAQEIILHLPGILEYSVIVQLQWIGIVLRFIPRYAVDASGQEMARL